MSASYAAASGLLVLALIVSCQQAPPPLAQTTVLHPADTTYTAWPSRFGHGSTVSDAEIAAVDIDVKPDGAGLPQGQGTVAEGQRLYTLQCAACHGATGIEGPNNVLVQPMPQTGMPFVGNPKHLKTIGTYWPYATTLFDYIQRSMPQTAPGSLTPDEVYSLTAFLLYRNAIIGEDVILNTDTLPQIEMPARDAFAPDDRLQFNTVH